MNSEELKNAIQEIEQRRDIPEEFGLLIQAAKEHLKTLPRVHSVGTYVVTYWNRDRTDAVVARNAAHADELVKGYGPTAKKHHVYALEWDDK